MAQTTCEILEIGLAGRDRAIHLACPPGMIPAAGQYMLASGLGTDEILPTALFLTNAEQDVVEFCGETPASWTPGLRISLRGPFGQGFHVPAKARRITLITLTEQFRRLLPVIRLAIRQNASISLFSNQLIEDLPAEVEALPLESIGDGWSWADYAAVEVRHEQLHQLRDLLMLKDGRRLTCPSEVLMLTPMPCGGVAECGVCAVSSNGRYHLTCKEGPVFDLNLIV